MTELPFKDPAERKTITFDFSGDAAVLSSATVTASVARGQKDATPSSVISGSPSIVGAKVLQVIEGGLAGSTYDLRCVATAADGEIHVAVGRLPVQNAQP